MYGEDLINLLQKSSHRIQPGDSPNLGIRKNQKPDCAALDAHPHERDAIVAREALLQDDTNLIIRLLLKFLWDENQVMLHLSYKLITPSIKRICIRTSSILSLPTLIRSMRCEDALPGNPGAIDEGLVLEIFTKRSIPISKF
ncbi:hypothetical protein V6N13_123426 [Hibiscus sabdariffa]